MMKFIAVLLAMAGGLPAQSARVLTRGDATTILMPTPSVKPGVPHVLPIWSGRSILSTIVNETPMPVLNSTTPDGRNEEIRFSVPGWSGLTLVGLWGNDEGEIVTGGYGSDEQGEASGFIVRIGRDRNNVTMMPVKEIKILVMTVGPGGMIWAIGSGKDKETDTRRDNILARISPKGKLLSSTMLKFPAIYGSEDVTSSSQLRPSSDGVAWLTSRNEYIEFATDGHEVLHIAGPGGRVTTYSDIGRLAVSAANTVLISKPVYVRNQPPKLNVWSLDRIKETWFLSEPAEGSFPNNTAIYGFDGNTLMTSGFSKAGLLLVRYALSETK